MWVFAMRDTWKVTVNQMLDNLTERVSRAYGMLW